MQKLLFLLCISIPSCFLQFDYSSPDLRKLSSSQGLTLKQRQALACTISEETHQDKERVFTSDGISCGQDITNLTINESQGNQTEEETYYENLIITPDAFAPNGSLDKAKEIVQSDNFSEAIKQTVSNKTLFNDGSFSVEEITAVIPENEYVIPQINSPSITISETEATLSFIGATNTMGFIFTALATAPIAKNPEKMQLQFNQGYNFTYHNTLFYLKNATQNVTFKYLKSCEEFTYYWMASNEDPTTYQYSTDIQQGNITTLGCVFGNYIRWIWLNIFIIISLIII